MFAGGFFPRQRISLPVCFPVVDVILKGSCPRFVFGWRQVRQQVEFLHSLTSFPLRPHFSSAVTLFCP